MGHISSDSILTIEAERFIREWNGPTQYILARTSGSTGTPKEIMLKKSDMRASAQATIKFFGLNQSSTLLLPLSPDYIAGKMQIVRAIESGCRLIVEQPSSTPFASYRGDCTMIPIVPSQLEGLYKSPVINGNASIIIGGAPLSIHRESTILSKGLNAYATYGMTETCSHVALRRIGQQAYQGLPGFIFSTDSRGCLTIGSSTMSFQKLTTNDVVQIINDSTFIWHGRYDNVINSGGVKIHPEEIERVMARFIPIEATAYVTSRPNDKWGEEAVIVTDSRLIDHSLLDALKEHMPPHHVPHDVVYVNHIPLTSSSKIIRGKLKS